ncbi:hypothetical protein MKX01_008527 [Papaver californicum]|nr:hypothetical protein MKX01_008527 [Papaver californicum]
MDTGQLIAGNAIIRKHKHENASDFQSQKSERDESPMKTRRKHNDILPRLRDLMDMEDQKDVRDNQLRVTMPQNIVPKKTKAYARKNATQCEVPELIVYLKETSNHAVNIRFDDEVPSCDKTAADYKKANHNSPLRFSSCTSDVHSDLIKVIMEDLASSSYAMVEHNTDNLMEHDKGKFNFTDGLGGVSCSEKFATSYTYKEVNSSSSSLSCAVEANVHETSSNVCLEKDKSAISEEQRHSELVHSLKTPTAEDSLGELRSASSRSIFTQHAHGESSFSAVDNPVALVTRSRKISYSAHPTHPPNPPENPFCSLFSLLCAPIFFFLQSVVLQSDWHTSPMRVAKADRKHYRKHQRWKLSLLCYKF